MKKICLAFDFDNTLAYFNDKKVGLFEIFKKLGVDEATIKKAYQQTYAQGFCAETFQKNIETLTGQTFDRQTITAQFNAWLKNSLKAYNDVSETFAKLKGQADIVIVTYGNKKYQQQKIDLLNIPADAVYFTTKLQTKAAPLRQLLQIYEKVIYVDDDLDELDAVKETLTGEPRLATIQIVRPDAKHPEKTSPDKHQIIHLLTELSKLLPQT